MVLPAPSIEYDIVGDTIMITQVSNWVLDTYLGYTFCAAFVWELSRSEDPQVQLSSIRAMNVLTGGNLKSTIFGSEACIAYCQLAHMKYFMQSLASFELEELFHEALVDGGPRSSRFQSRVWSKISFWLDILMSSFFKAQVSMLFFIVERRN